MEVVVATRSIMDRPVPADAAWADPLWSEADRLAFWQVLLAGGSTDPLPPGEDLPSTRRGQLAELQRLAVERARAAAREARLLVALAGHEQRAREVTLADPDGDRPRAFVVVDEVLEEVSVALRRSVGTVRRDVALARGLAALPATSDALAAGDISPDHAEVITRLADGLPAHLRPDFEGRVLARAAVATPGETAAFARRLRARLDVVGEEARRQAAARHIEVRIWAEDDGLACLLARLPLADAARVHAALEAGARGVSFDPDQTMGQRRVAALVEALCGAARVDTGGGAGSCAGGDVAPSAGPVPAPALAVSVVVDAATLLGLDDAPAFLDLPAEGRVPMAAGALRGLLADPTVPVTLRRLLTDPRTGEVVDRGRTAYRVTDELRDFVMSRDGTCRFPHCTRSARTADIDHAVAWDDSGETSRRNLVSLCRRHHVLKTHGAWSTVRRRDDGSVEWRAPDGGRVVTHPWTADRPDLLRRWVP